MSTGRLVMQGRLDELRAAGSRRLIVTTPDTDAARRVLVERGLTPDPLTAEAPDTVTAALPDGIAVEELTAALVAGGVRVRGIAASGETLEDRFVALTGEGFDVAG
jgi:ABC-2 type transport system ATP-binding protein